MIDNNWFGHLVNQRQSSEERKAKYSLCKALGDSVHQRKRRRDWRWNKIARVHGYSDFKSMKALLLDEEEKS